jgi:hypothetical protein
MLTIKQPGDLQTWLQFASCVGLYRKAPMYEEDDHMECTMTGYTQAAMKKEYRM